MIKNKLEGKFKFIIMSLIRIILIIAFITSIYFHKDLVLIVSIIAFIITLIPDILYLFFKIKIEGIIELFSLLLIYGLLLIIETRGLLSAYWWWDLSLSLTSSIIIGLAGFSFLYAINKTNNISYNYFIICLLSFSLSFSLGGLWELFEFSLDYFFKFNLQPTLQDTMIDLIFTFIGSLIVSILGYSYLKNGKIKIVSEYIVKLIERNPQIFKEKNEVEKSSLEIIELIKKGESDNLEFKSSLRTNVHTNNFDENIEHSALKTIVAFMNSQGGTLLVGVNNSGEVIGLEKDRFKDNDSLALHLTNLLKNKIGQEYLSLIKFNIYPIEDKHVIKIKCYESNKPVFLKHNKDEEFYIRSGPSSMKLTGRSLIEYIKNNFE